MNLTVIIQCLYLRQSGYEHIANNHSVDFYILLFIYKHFTSNIEHPSFMNMTNFKQYIQGTEKFRFPKI